MGNDGLGKEHKRGMKQTEKKKRRPWERREAGTVAITLTDAF